MAGAGAKLFTSGSVLTADQVNTFLMDQSIMRFSSTTARDDAFGGAGEPTLAEGMFAYTTDTNTLWLYNGSEWVNLLGSDIGTQALSNRNVIINGAMQVAQRGTSTASITTANYYTADRFIFEPSFMGTWTQSIQNDAPTGSGFRKSLKLLCTTADASPAASDYILFDQRLEGQNIQQFLKGTASAKSFALSFWVKSNATGTYNVELLDNDNTRVVTAAYTVDVSGTWEKKTIIFPADTTGAFDNDNASSMQLNWWLGAGTTFTSGTRDTLWGTVVNADRAVGQTNVAAATSNYWQITGVQLEAGAVATPFEFEDYGTTLVKCQRYYTKWSGAANDRISLGVPYSTTKALPVLHLPVSMRTGATSVEYLDLQLEKPGVGSSAVTAVVLSGSSTNSFCIDITSSSLTAFETRWLQLSSSSGFLAASAEL